jgi:hypothetical protein
MIDQLDWADFVLVICTETYYRRFRGREEPGKGKGADWEGALITQEIYDARSATTKFVPVIFDPTHERFIPEPLRGHTFYLPVSEDGYQALYDFLLDQSGIEPGEIGVLKKKLRKRGTPLSFESPGPRPPLVSSARLRHGAERLFGREEDLKRLDAAWDDPKTHVLTIVAWGGVGETSLVVEWIARKAADGWPGFERVFEWTFYSQGTREQGAVSAELFIAEALKFFGDPDPMQGSSWDRGERLARLVAERRSLLVLDGLEPLQHPPGSAQPGKLKDPALETLLKGLARYNPGLCLITTRERVDDLKTWHATTAPEWNLDNLTPEAGAAVLHQAGARRAGAVEIKPDDQELKDASEEGKATPSPSNSSAATWPAPIAVISASARGSGSTRPTSASKAGMPSASWPPTRRGSGRAARKAHANWPCCGFWACSTAQPIPAVWQPCASRPPSLASLSLWPGWTRRTGTSSFPALNRLAWWRPRLGSRSG